MAAACRAYAEALSSRLDEIDAIVSECGLDIQGRWPLFMAFIRDEMFYTYMDKHGLFAQEGNFYGMAYQWGNFEKSLVGERIAFSRYFFPPALSLSVILVEGR